MRISDWSSDVCSSDLGCALVDLVTFADFASGFDCVSAGKVAIHAVGSGLRFKIADVDRGFAVGDEAAAPPRPGMAELCPVIDASGGRSEEHTSELQSLMRISYAVFCLKKKNTNTTQN